jgi:hypothetical protein
VDQDQVIILCLKAALIAGFASLVAWVAVYHVLTRGSWRRNPIGRTLVVKSLLIAGLFVPTALGLFFQLNRFDSRIVAWTDVVLIGAVSPVMCWRCIVFAKLGREDKSGDGKPLSRLIPPRQPPSDTLGLTVCAKIGG